jgi:hypothetical protein
MAAVNTTIAYNNAFGVDAGGGLDEPGGGAILDNTIVALNTEAAMAPGDISGLVSSTSSFNLIGAGGPGGLTNGDNGNQVGGVDPGFGHGSLNGTTFYFPLLPSSPAVDMGNNAWPSIPRPASL